MVIGAHVDESTKAKIVNNEYVDLGKLLEAGTKYSLKMRVGLNS